jgi:radical SAM protein with 4Fe4S-binding SPASM domain
MHEQSELAAARNWFNNEFLETIYAKFETGFTAGGTFCRDCEEKLFTLNADGTIAGCPNSAPEHYFGNISDPIEELLANPQRLDNIVCERSRDPRCYECPVFSYCGGDCHQLSWEDNICGAPKALMRNLAGINTKLKIIPIGVI